MAISVFVPELNFSATTRVRFANGSASAPSITFASATNTGIYTDGSGRVRFTATGGLSGVIYAGGIWIPNDGGSFSLGTTQDVHLYRDAANVLAQRNGTNAQTFRLYNTFTDASNNEYAQFVWNSNIAGFSTTKSGSGTHRELRLGTVGAAPLSFQTNNTTRWQFDSSGHLTALTDNTYDIGASGATRPRNVYVGTHFLGVLNATRYAWVSGPSLFAPADGIISLQNSGGNDFNRLQFGGTTSGFPAIKRSSVNLEARLADDSGYTGFTASILDSTGRILSYSPTAGVGYGTGAGGTVTQLTSKATGVTLNKTTGQITTHNAALNANTTVTFVLTNSTIAAVDTVLVSHQGGGTGGNYQIWVGGITAGAVSIHVRNITAGSLSDAVVINFVIIKGASA